MTEPGTVDSEVSTEDFLLIMNLVEITPVQQKILSGFNTGKTECDIIEEIRPLVKGRFCTQDIYMAREYALLAMGSTLKK